MISLVRCETYVADVTCLLTLRYIRDHEDPQHRTFDKLDQAFRALAQN